MLPKCSLRRMLLEVQTVLKWPEAAYCTAQRDIRYRPIPDVLLHRVEARLSCESTYLPAKVSYQTAFVV